MDMKSYAHEKYIQKVKNMSIPKRFERLLAKYFDFYFAVVHGS